MQEIRFYTFAQMIDSIHKSIYKIKSDLIPIFGVKSVHMFWIYELYSHPDGLSAAELAEQAMISRSLVSREIDRLLKDDYVELRENSRGKRRNYNSRITLTEKGVKLAEQIQGKALSVQASANIGISPEELESFYKTLEKLRGNLSAIVEQSEYGENGAKLAKKELDSEKTRGF